MSYWSQTCFRVWDITISDLENILITQGQDAKIMSFKIWVLLITLSMISDVMGRLGSSTK